MLPDLSGRLSKAQNHHHSHHPFDALIRFVLRIRRQRTINQHLVKIYAKIQEILDIIIYMRFVS